MSDEHLPECQIHLATLAVKLDKTIERTNEIHDVIDTTTRKNEERDSTLFRKLEELREDHHRADLIAQSTDDRLAAHEAADNSRFHRLWWVVGAGASIVAAVFSIISTVLFKLIWG